VARPEFGNIQENEPEKFVSRCPGLRIFDAQKDA